jgi:Ca-activated chloride channel family protein
MDISFEHIEFVWLLALLIPVFLLWFSWEWRKAAILKKLATNPRILNTLLKNFNPQKSKIRLFTFSTAIIGITLALMNPRVVDEKANVPSEGVQVMFLIDVSNSMLADDVVPNRLEKARSFAIKLAERFGGSRIGLIAFAGEARLQMPPTTDLGAIRQALQTLSPASVALQGTDVEAALIEANRSLSANALAKKCVILVSDGEALEGNALATARELKQSGLLMYAVGVGSLQGSKLLEPETRLPITDENDQEVISRLDEDQLGALASATGGEYLHLQETETALNTMVGYLNELEKMPLANGDLVNYYSFTPWILMFVFLLLTWEWWLSWIHAIRPARKRIPMAVTIFLMMFGSSAFAQNGQKDFDAGLTAYKSGNYGAAVEAFEKALEKEPAKAEAKFYRAMAAYRQKNFPQAAAEFSELASTAPPDDVKSASLNNAGLAYANNNNLAQAIDMFKLALKANPSDADIRKNLQKAITDLKKQQPPPEEKEEQEPPMDKDDANQKLQDVTDQERQAREKLKPRKTGVSNRKNW